jgi:hypothetical protein
LPKKGTGKIDWFEGKIKGEYLEKIISKNTSLVTENYEQTFSTDIPRPQHE